MVTVDSEVDLAGLEAESEGAVERVDTGSSVLGRAEDFEGRSVAISGGEEGASGVRRAVATATSPEEEVRRGRKRTAALMDNDKGEGLGGEGSGEDEDMIQPALEEDDSVSREVSQQVVELSLDSPSSFGKAKRSRFATTQGHRRPADNPDSVPAMVNELTKLLDYVASVPSLQHGSASFMRDYLRTMLVETTVAANDAILASEMAAQMKGHRPALFEELPDELAKYVFSFLDGRSLAAARAVSRRWNMCASDEIHWKNLATERWRSLATDPSVWKLLCPEVSQSDPNKWRKIYPVVAKSQQWRCRLQKTGRFICNLIAHQISGDPLGEDGLPVALVVERRFNWSHLDSFVVADACLLYFEPETEKDRVGFEEFIDYLVQRTRAGLALQEDRRYIFIPPCEFSRSLDYHGKSLLGYAQSSLPTPQAE